VWEQINGKKGPEDIKGDLINLKTKMEKRLVVARQGKGFKEKKV